MKEINLKNSDIYIGKEVFDLLLEQLIARAYTQVFILVDENTEQHCLPIVNRTLFDTKVIRIKSGESAKNIETVQHIWNELLTHQANRNAVLINLGGGVIGDIGGFAASTYKRGIDFIHIPTSLLAMVDSSVGGKTGIDYLGLKNMIGTFAPPEFVCVYPDFLKTLDQRELLSGFAEIIKHGLIADDAYWEKTKRITQLTPETLSPLLYGSIKLKAGVVKKDPMEDGWRKILNFGHTIGHAIEAYSLAHDKTPLKHGEAVAIGIVCEAYLSKEILGLSNRDLRVVSEFVLLHFKKYSLKNIFSKELIALMQHDKKNEQGELNFTLLKRIGKAGINYACTPNQISLALNYYDGL